MGIFSLRKDKSGLRDSVALAELSASDTRAYSAFFAGPIAGKHLRLEDLSHKGSNRVNVSAKSFSGAANRQLSPSKAQESQDDRSNSLDNNPRGVEYSSIKQFNQMVELYRGSISTVYRASCTLTKWPVIIKAYQKSKMKEKNFLRMEREIRLMRLFAGEEAVVQLYNVFEDCDYKYLIMEMCKGGDLFKAMLLRGGRMNEQWACAEMVAPLLTILIKLHKKHILHRDIKPENIFLSSGQRFKLGDFGLAIQSDLELPFTRSGTLDYLSPEVLANPSCELQESPEIGIAELKQHEVRPYNEKVDCWAAGVLAYELVVGHPPFEVRDEAKTASAILYKHDFHLPSKFSAQWADFVVKQTPKHMQALQKNPEQRPSAAQLLEHPWVKMHAATAFPDTGNLLDFSLQALSRTQPELRQSKSMGATLHVQAHNMPASGKDASSVREENAVKCLDRTRPGSPLKPKEPASAVASGLRTSILGRKASKLTLTDSASTTTSSIWSDSGFSSSSERLSTSPGRAGLSLSKLANVNQQVDGDSKCTENGVHLAASAGLTGTAEHLAEEQEKHAGGMRNRMKLYFRRQA